MPIQEEIDSMSVAEKLEAMELLWASLSSTPEDIPSPAWHGEVLAERRRKLAAGEERLIPWEEAKAKLRELGE